MTPHREVIDAALIRHTDPARPRFRDMPSVDVVLLDPRHQPSMGAWETPIIAIARRRRSDLRGDGGCGRAMGGPLAAHREGP
jgi:hypothetical protein